MFLNVTQLSSHGANQKLVAVVERSVLLLSLKYACQFLNSLDLQKYLHVKEQSIQNLSGHKIITRKRFLPIFFLRAKIYRTLVKAT
jgi:hypothetical protein